MFTVSRYNAGTGKWETVQSKDRIVAEILTVTPEMAIMFLENNKKNRPLSANQVAAK